MLAATTLSFFFFFPFYQFNENDKREFMKTLKIVFWVRTSIIAVIIVAGIVFFIYDNIQCRKHSYNNNCCETTIHMIGNLEKQINELNVKIEAKIEIVKQDTIQSKLKKLKNH